MKQPFRQLSWATYMVKSNEQNCYPQDRVWLTDRDGDYVRYHLRAMAAHPKLAPVNSNHFVRSTSAEGDITYSDKSIEYTTSDAQSSEVFRLVSKHPICGPSRASLWTGIYPHNSGLYGHSQNTNRWYNNPVLKNTKPIFEHLSDNGYQYKKYDE